MLLLNDVKGENVSISSSTQKINSVNSLVVDSHDIDIFINNLDEATIEERYRVRNDKDTPISKIEIWLKYRKTHDMVVIDQNSIELVKNIVILSNGTFMTIFFNSFLDKYQTYSFTLYYKLEKKCVIINSNPPYYFFDFTSVILHNTTRLTMNIRLPEKSNLHIFPSEIETPTYFPESGNPEVVAGYVWVFWEFENIMQITFQGVQIFFDEPPSDVPAVWLIVVGPLVGIIFGAGGVYWWMRKKSKKAIEEIGKIFLTDDQKLLLKIILENEGKITQKELIERTQFTKSKISRNLFPLEEYGLIQREKWGKEYKINITERGVRISE